VENVSVETVSVENGFPSDPSNIINNSVFPPKPGEPVAPAT
jgi:hypothetical protein